MLEADPQNNYYVPHLEWESVAFPIVFSDLKFERDYIKLDEAAKIELWRDHNRQLKAKLLARTTDIGQLNQVPYIGKGNIVTGSIIEGTDSDNNRIILSSCILGNFKTTNAFQNLDGYLIEVDIIFDKATIVFAGNPSGSITDIIRYEWFLVANVPTLFYGTTIRTEKGLPRKSRLGVDHYDDEKESIVGRQSSRDFILIDLPDFQCIVAKVPKQFIENKVEGLCLEFRGAHAARVDEKLLSDLKFFLAFLFGCRLYYMGYSSVINGILTEALIENPETPLKKDTPMPPIKYNLHYEWGNIMTQGTLLFAEYRKLNNQLSLNGVIDRFLIAKNIAVGVNLPLLAGALEVLADKYLKMTANNKLEYLPKKEYEQLINDELKSLKTKLKTVAGGEIMLNKFTGAFRKGPNEKLNHFFTLLGLDLSKEEKEALALRNKMAHGQRDYTLDDNAHSDLVLTRVYEVLMNKVLLKVLGYDGYYIDYSTKGSPSRPLNPDAPVHEVKD